MKKNALKVVIITGEGFEDEEVIYPVIRLVEEGISVDIATKEKKLVTGRVGFPLALLVKYYAGLVDATQLRVGGYDAVIIPGGFEAPDRVRQIPEVLAFVKKMHQEKKLVAALCHGPWVLISAKIIKGKKATGYPGISDDIKNAGAKYVDEPVVVDGNLITSRHPKDVGDFMKALISYLCK